MADEKPVRTSKKRARIRKDKRVIHLEGPAPVGEQAGYLIDDAMVSDVFDDPSEEEGR